MKKIKAFLGLKLIRFGIWIYEHDPKNYGLMTSEDKKILLRLWKYHDEFEANLNN